MQTLQESMGSNERGYVCGDKEHASRQTLLEEHDGTDDDLLVLKGFVQFNFPQDKLSPKKDLCQKMIIGNFRNRRDAIVSSTKIRIAHVYRTYETKHEDVMCETFSML